MTWIQTDHTFSPNGAILTITSRHSQKHTMIKDLLTMMEGHPKFVVAGMEGMIEALRPDLKGCQIVGISFDLSRQLWKFSVLHKSLPETEVCKAMPEQELIK